MATDIAELGIKIEAKDIKDAVRQLDRLEGQSKKNQKVNKNLTGSFNLLRAAIATVGVGFLTKQFIDAASTSEQYRIRLNALTGSVREGGRMFEEMTEFASQVPFQYEEIMGAATQLSSVLEGGVDEVAKYMPMVADLAAVSGLSIQQTADQVSRMFSAGAASADLFRERGVLAMMGFRAGVSYEVEETRDMMIESWESASSRFRGASDEMADSWAGQMSMMSDRWFQFRTDVMDADPFEYLKATADLALDSMSESADEAEDLAENIGEGIVDLSKNLAMGAAMTLDAVNPALTGIQNTFNGFLETWNSLPAWVQELGIAGALLTGKKGAVAIVGTLGVSKMLGDWLNENVADLGEIEIPGAEKSIIETVVGTTDENESAVNKLKEIFAELDARVAESRRKATQAEQDVTGGGGAGSVIEGMFSVSDESTEKTTANLDTISSKMDSLQREIEGWGKQSADVFAEFATGAEVSVSDMVDSMIKDFIRMQAYQNVFGPLFSGIASGFSPGMQGAQAGGAAGALSFAGGGYTGSGPRSGGMDGQGGFPAILHPNETVVDHTKGGRGGGTTVNVINNVGAEVTTRETPDGNGGQNIEVLIDQAVARNLGQFGSNSNKTLRQQFGASQRLASR